MTGRRRPGRFRFVRLLLRARNAPPIATGLVAVAVATWAAAHWLATKEGSAGAIERLPVAALAPLLGAAVASAGFPAADEELERTAAVRWRRIRLLQVLLAGVALAGALALTGLWEPRQYGAFELVRNAAGTLGAIALATALIGARLAWLPVAGYLLAVLPAQPEDPATAWWSWPVQPWASSLARWPAAVLLALGAAGYAWRGARSS
ncbi:MAG TPA: hypothetical protein VIL37_11040 [Natronosporangium sp.]